jgi:hypothetical protein
MAMGAADKLASNPRDSRGEGIGEPGEAAENIVKAASGRIDVVYIALSPWFHQSAPLARRSGWPMARIIMNAKSFFPSFEAILYFSGLSRTFRTRLALAKPWYR